MEGLKGSQISPPHFVTKFGRPTRLLKYIVLANLKYPKVDGLGCPCFARNIDQYLNSGPEAFIKMKIHPFAELLLRFNFTWSGGNDSPVS
jgi:hypothetical protein